MTSVPVIEVLGGTAVGGVTPVPVIEVLGGTIVVDVLMSVDIIDCVLIDTVTLMSGKKCQRNIIVSIKTYVELILAKNKLTI